MPLTICHICGAQVYHPVGGFFCNHSVGREATKLAAENEAREYIAEQSSSDDPDSLPGRAIVDAFTRAEVFQSVPEILWLYEALKGIEIKSVLDIGAWHGGTALLWHELFGAEVLSIDNNPREPYAASRDNLIVADSHDKKTAAKVRKIKRQFDMVFIDGDHSLESVSRDFELYAPLCRKGGVVVLHDILWDKETVGEFFNSLQGRKDSFSKHYGIGVLFK